MADSTINPPSQSGAIIGEIKIWATDTAPDGWLICDGSAISRTTYADLYSILGTTYGTGDGSTTFNIPNLCGRTVIGVGTSNATGATAHTLAQSDGEETHKLTTSEMPKHTHSIYHVNHCVPPASSTVVGANYLPDQWTSSGSAGGDAAHNNMLPYLALNYIIYAGR